MKKILYLLGIIIFTISCCGSSANTASATLTNNTVTKVYLNNQTTRIFTVNIENHTYIVLKGLHGESIIHAEHCSCKNK